MKQLSSVHFISTDMCLLNIQKPRLVQLSFENDRLYMLEYNGSILGKNGIFLLITMPDHFSFGLKYSCINKINIVITANG